MLELTFMAVYAANALRNTKAARVTSSSPNEIGSNAVRAQLGLEAEPGSPVAERSSLS